MPTGMKVVGDNGLPRSYNKLDFSLSESLQTIQKVGNIELECSVDDEEHGSSEGLSVVSGGSADENSDGKGNNIVLWENDENECVEKEAWRISRIEKGHVSSMHVSRTIKMLLPREFISLNRSQRHIASVYLPGKSPLDPDHDILKFSDVAIKAIKGKKKYFELGRIIYLQENGGSNIFSASSKKGKGFRCRCSLYQLNGNTVSVPADVLVSDWILRRTLLGPVNLRRTSRNGVYELAVESLDSLMKMGYFPLSSETAHGTCADESSKESDIGEDEKLDLLEHGFYEVDDKIDRQINSKTHEYEYRVRFRGYAESDDAWLPALLLIGQLISLQAQAMAESVFIKLMLMKHTIHCPV